MTLNPKDRLTAIEESEAQLRRLLAKPETKREVLGDQCGFIAGLYRELADYYRRKDQ